MPEISSLFAQAPHWAKQPFSVPRPLPANVKSWLYETGSLTQRLRAFYGAQFAVRILQQRWYKAFIDESRLLGLPASQYVLIREVLLHAAGQPLILARSIIPASTIAVAQRNLSHLGTRPLGEVIFAYPDLQRLALELAYIQPSCWQAHSRQQFALHQPLWGRRTVYAIPTQPLLVSELFLPGVLDIPGITQQRLQTGE